MVEPTAPENLPLKHIKAVLAKCPSFWTFAGVVNEAAALLKIDYIQQSVARPSAVVGIGTEDGRLSEMIGVEDFAFDDQGWLVFAADGDKSNSEADDLMTFWNNIGNAVAEFIDEARAYGFRLTGINRVEGPHRRFDKADDPTEPWLFAVYGVTWEDSH